MSFDAFIEAAWTDHAFDEALRGAPADLPAASPAIRALAVAGCNLSASLEEKADRRPDESAAALALALRAAGDVQAFVESAAQAEACHARLPADEQRWCRAHLEALRA